MGLVHYQQIHFPEVQTICITEKIVHMYLVWGTERALLIDTGLGQGNLNAAVAQLWKKSLLVANTHGHEDHVGANTQFDQVLAHPGDWDSIRRYTSCSAANLLPLREGCRIDLGNRSLNVLSLPGHTPGSIAFWDQTYHILFCGDYVSDRPIYLCYEGASIKEYCTSLTRILSMAPEIRFLLGGHGSPKQGMEQVRKLLACATALMDGTLKGTPWKDFHGTPFSLYSLDNAAILAK